MTTRIRILIAEDNDFVRQQVRRCLEHSGRFDVLAEACDGTEAVRLIAQCQPAVVLMDISMPRMNGLEVTEYVTRQFPGVRVIIHSSSTEPNTVRQAFQMGASAYVVKGNVPQLTLIIEEVAAGKIYTDALDFTDASAENPVHGQSCQPVNDNQEPAQRPLNTGRKDE